MTSLIAYCSSHGSIATVKDAAFVAVMVQLGTNDCLPASQPRKPLLPAAFPGVEL